MHKKINFLQMPDFSQADLSRCMVFGMAGWLTVKNEFISVERHSVKLVGQRILLD